MPSAKCFYCNIFGNIINIQVHYIIDVIINKISIKNMVENLNSNSLIIFDSEFYLQRDVVGISLSFETTFANFFMAYEKLS